MTKTGQKFRGQRNKQGSMEEEDHQLYRRPQMTGQARDEEEDSPCPRQGDIQSSGVVQEANALVLVSSYTGQYNEVFLTSLERVNACHLDLLEAVDTGYYKLNDEQSLTIISRLIYFVEHSSSALECRTCNREYGFESTLLPFRSLVIFDFSQLPSSLSCINEYLAINSSRNVSE